MGTPLPLDDERERPGEAVARVGEVEQQVQAEDVSPSLAVLPGKDSWLVSVNPPYVNSDAYALIAG